MGKCSPLVSWLISSDIQSCFSWFISFISHGFTLHGTHSHPLVTGIAEPLSPFPSHVQEEGEVDEVRHDRFISRGWEDGDQGLRWVGQRWIPNIT